MSAAEETTEKIRLTPEIIEGYLQTLEKKGRNPASLQNYRGILTKLYEYLPEDKTVDKSTPDLWREWLGSQGYYARTINAHMSVINGLFSHLDRRDWQTKQYIRKLDDVQPELTRAEYMRLLRAAKHMGKERTYLLIKTLGGAGVRVQELPQITAESLSKDSISLFCHNCKRVLYIPEALKQELRDYVKREGIREGPIFVTRDGVPLTRSSVWHCINRVGKEARVSEEKANPRCLWKMYQSTYAGIESNIAGLVAQAYNRMMEEEQLVIGWEA